MDTQTIEDKVETLKKLIEAAEASKAAWDNVLDAIHEAESEDSNLQSAISDVETE